MIKYAKQIEEDLLEEIITTAPSFAVDHLFQVRNNNKQKLLPEEQAQAFCCSTARL